MEHTTLARFMAKRMDFWAPCAKKLLSQCVLGQIDKHEHHNSDSDSDSDSDSNDDALTISIEAIGSGLLIIPVMYCSNTMTVRELKDDIIQCVPSLIDNNYFDIDLFNGHGCSVLNDENQLRDAKIVDNSVLTLMCIIDKKKALIKFCRSFDNFFPIANEWHLANPIINWIGIQVEPVTENVTTIDLRLKHLSGTISPIIAYIPSLVNLDLANNYLNGTIPTEIGLLINLEYIFMYDNRLTGKIPSEIGKLENLRDLNLHSNQLDGNIPTELGNLHKLLYINLGHNNLVGRIPTEIGTLNSIRAIYLANNKLTGQIPTTFNFPQNFQNLNLSSNLLTGQIPIGIQNMTYLNVRNNQFFYN